MVIGTLNRTPIDTIQCLLLAKFEALLLLTIVWHRITRVPPAMRPRLLLLDLLVENGSSAAFRMRDDFVTPVSAA